MKPVIVHSAARAELDEAMAYYESRTKGLGLDLQSKVEEAVTKIQESPGSWPPHKHTGFRKCFVERFTFTVFYLEMVECIWVVAIAHGSRRPDYWKRRRRDYRAEHPAAPNAGIASRLTGGHHWPGIGEPGR